jgi:hypothetical protein
LRIFGGFNGIDTVPPHPAIRNIGDNLESRHRATGFSLADNPFIGWQNGPGPREHLLPIFYLRVSIANATKVPVTLS